jgi:hypothetical protein
MLKDRDHIRSEPGFGIDIIDNQRLLSEEAASGWSLFGRHRRCRYRALEKSLDQVQVHPIRFRIVQKHGYIIKLDGLPQRRRKQSQKFLQIASARDRVGDSQ